MARPSTRRRAPEQPPPASPFSTATYASTRGFVDVLDYLLETSKKASEKRALDTIADLYAAALEEPDIEDAEARIWEAYVADVWKAKRSWPKGQLRQRQGIGYAEILGPNPSAFLLVWNHGKPLDKAEWVSAEETPKEMWNELCNHFLTEAFDHAQQPVTRIWPKPPITLLPGLEDMRDDWHEQLVAMLNERRWPIEFDEPEDEEGAAPSGSQRKNTDVKRPLPWTLYELLKEVKDVPGFDEYERERTVLNDIYHDADGVTFAKDVFDGPIVVARARQVMPDDSDDRVWWLKLETKDMYPEDGDWYLDGDEATDGLDEDFVTDALLRYGCVTHPFPSRDLGRHAHHRSLTLLAGLEDRREKIADSLEDAIAAYDGANGAVSVEGRKKEAGVKSKSTKATGVQKGKGNRKADEKVKPKPRVKAKATAKGKRKAKSPSPEDDEGDTEEVYEEEKVEGEMEEEVENKEAVEDEAFDNDNVKDETSLDDPENDEEYEEEGPPTPTPAKRTRSAKQPPATQTREKRRKAAPKPAATKKGRKK